MRRGRLRVARVAGVLALLTVISAVPGAEAAPGAASARAPGPLVIGGTEVDNSDLPYVVSVRSRWHLLNANHVCGGVIVSYNTILTTANCVRNGERPVEGLYVVAGYRFLLLPIISPPTMAKIDVANVYVHPEHNDTEHNIAALKLEKALPTSNRNIYPIALQTSRLADGTECELSGWGSTFPGSPLLSPTLNAVSLPLVNRRACCKTEHGNTIRPDEICAGDGNGDACQGDMGGPLTCGGLLVGLVSRGTGCNRPGYPRIFVNLRVYARWIQDAVDRDNPPGLPTVEPPPTQPPTQATEPTLVQVTTEDPSPGDAAPEWTPTADPPAAVEDDEQEVDVDVDVDVDVEVEVDEVVGDDDEGPCCDDPKPQPVFEAYVRVLRWEIRFVSKQQWTPTRGTVLQLLRSKFAFLRGL